MKTLSRLNELAGHRDFITTDEFAMIFNVASQTVRKNYSIEKICYGVVPKKFGNRLLWPVSDIAKVLGA